MASQQVIVKIPGARLSFPSLGHTESYEGRDTGRYTATLLIPKSETKLMAEIAAAMRTVERDAWGAKIPANRISTLQDGDEKEMDGYAGCWSLKAATRRRPILLDRHRQPVDQPHADEVFYAGCIVTASVDFSASTDSYGKHRIWCNLRGVQFVRDGERFGGGVPVNVESEFDSFTDDDGDGAGSRSTLEDLLR
jgi:hypothetical protein